MKMTEEINIKLQNCNNIDQAEIVIQKKSLNIKYGPNGLGKSTIAKAIVASTKDDDSLQQLMPFKQRNEPKPDVPSIKGAESINKVLSFDDLYVNQFVFKPDEVVTGSFDIFIKTDEYETAMKEIEDLFAGIKQTFENKDEIEAAISDLTEFKDSFLLTKNGELSKSGKGYKAFARGNKTKNVPPELQPFKSFIQSKESTKWIAWQKGGNAFLTISENCPYCSLDISVGDTKETAQHVAEVYHSKEVDNQNLLQAVINRLSKYFNEKCNKNLLQIIEGDEDLTPESETFIKSLSSEILTLIKKLESLRYISFSDLRDVEVEKIEEYFQNLRIDFEKFDKVNSHETGMIINPINDKLNALIKQIGLLKGKINKQKDRIRKTIEKNQEQINEFLQSAGYRYKVEIVPEKTSYKMKLIHLDYTKPIENALEHLSYGEKNAFALILFMYQALREKPDLIILDDPISSFDKNKKFAILHKLFRGKQSFMGMTILMLTHDIEPAIDMIRIKGINQKLHALNPSASFLSSSNGIVKEVEILREDIQTFAKICTKNIKSADNDIIKVIYLRRHYEILDNFGDEYNLLASLLHKRKNPTTGGPDGPIMTPEQITNAETNIAKLMCGFQYSEVLTQVENTEEIIAKFKSTNVGYEKIQLFRIANNNNLGGDVITKFVNETFHIENEYVMQLNPQKFDSVPEYILKECETMLPAMNPV